MQTFEFKTIKSAVSDILLKEKGSKFIGYAFPVSNENEVKFELNKAKILHPKATHHCYAYRLGINGENYRANDDGEPSGSAGLPIYNQLLANDLTQILVIVVRYYGGTKLGVSGLVKTYKDCAKLTLDEAQVIIKELEITIAIDFPFALQNQIFTLINKFGGRILDFQSADSCNLTTTINLSNKENISRNLLEMHQINFEFLD